MFFRAFYAIRPLTSPSGMPTNAIYGFLSMIFKLLKDEKPDYVVFCYDRKEPSFRKDLYTDYKANRSETPEDLIPQIPYIKKLADLLGIPSVERDKFEADDLIGTLTQIAKAKDLDVYIVSGDKDFGQLVNDQVWLYDTMKNVKYDANGVKEKWGVWPHQIVDYLSIVGDTSDNVPGVKGIGAVGAVKLISEFNSLDGIYQNIEQVKGALKEKLITGKEMAFLSKRLITIVQDVPLASDLESYSLKEIDYSGLKSVLHELDFKNLEKSLDTLPHFDRKVMNNTSVNPVNPPELKMTIDNSKDVLDKKNQDRLSFEEKIISEANFSDIITVLQKNDNTLWGIQTEHSVLIVDAKEKNIIFNIQCNPILLATELYKHDITWKGFDLKSFFHIFNFKKTQKVGWDSQLAAYLIKAGENMEFDHIVTRFTGELPSDLPTPTDLVNKHLKLEKILYSKLIDISAVSILEKIELPLINLLFKMEQKGVALDVSFLNHMSRALNLEIQKLDEDIIKLSGEKFNIASPKQLSNILFEKLKLPPSKKTKTGFSTDNDVLEKLKNSHPIINLLLKYREYTKLKSTYVDSLPTMVKEDGRIHTTFNQALTTTGRLSSIDPNLQNIPIRTPKGSQVRKAFVAAEGYHFLSIDYSQIELRILAHYSEDKNLIYAFENDQDIHQATAAEVFGVSLKDVTPDMRRTAKAVNFGIAYGQGAFGLAETLNISRIESSEIIKKYFMRFPGVQSYISDTIEKAKSNGYVETLSGRRRYIDEFKSSNGAIKKFAERAAINAPIQGSASDIVKLAMIEVGYIEDLPLILQIHDELIFEGKLEIIDQHKKMISSKMENILKLKVPLKVNASVGLNWEDAH